jgi:rare lipoprotein A
MSGKPFTRLDKFKFPLLIAVGITLAGCDENGAFMFPGSGDGDAGSTTGEAARSVELVERDVEAPDVFQVTDAGLWDGRPSLGGVWVAHPDVQGPERVIIRNESNGTFVIGALFRRERDASGPRLQVSSDAAATLEMLAGAPAELNVTALRREEAPVAPTTEAVTDFGQPAGIDATPLDPIAGAAAAIDAAESAAPPTATAPTATAAGLDRPFIQIGIFSVEANATRTADQMRATGIVPTVLRQESQGRTFWRVIVGPATSASERAELLVKVKAQGFADAYFVTN